MIRFVLAAIVFALFGCGDTSLGRFLEVAIDPAFTDEERVGIEDALIIWQAVIPELQFEVTYQKPDPSPEWAKAEGVRIVRTANHEDFIQQCPNNLPGAIGIYSPHYGICMDAGSINSMGFNWRTIALHEVGHRLGLKHFPAPSIMTPYTEDMAQLPTCKDIAAARELLELPPESC